MLFHTTPYYDAALAYLWKRFETFQNIFSFYSVVLSRHDKTETAQNKIATLVPRIVHHDTSPTN